MYIKLKVDSSDKVVGYLIVIAFVDDVRFFGTEPEIEEYKKNVMSRLKVKFVDPPVEEFISIETYQDLNRGTCELKMPRYFEKAKTFFKDFIKGNDFKKRTIPLSVIDEKILLAPALPEEIHQAKNLPFLQAVGILSYPASNCKFEMRYAISVLGSRRAGWSTKQFQIAVKLFEYALTTCDIGLMFSDGLDPHGRNVLYAYGDASLRLPRPQGCRILMLNGAAVSFTSKMQTLTAPSTTWAETKTLFDCSTDVLGLRNLLYELGHLQDGPTTIYQDNKSAIQIATNRGSLGKTSRAMDLQTLSIRDRIEDHQVFPIYLKTDKMLADMGSKALPETPFVRFRDCMNGYALVHAHYPELQLPQYVYNISDDPDFNRDVHHSSSRISALIMSMNYHTLSGENEHDDFYYQDDNLTDDEEEEEDDTSSDDGEDAPSENIDNSSYGPSTPTISHHQLPNVKRQPNMRIRGGAPNHDKEEAGNDDDQHHSSDTHDFTSEFVHDLVYLNVYKLQDPTPDPYVFNLQLFPQGIWENDDLPDPRLYNINVQDLRHWHIQDSLSTTPYEEMTYYSFYHYLQAMEPAYLIVKEEEARNKYTSTTVEQHLPTTERVILAAPSVLMFFQECYPFSLDSKIRSRQINRALNTFIIRLDTLIANKIIDDVSDNVFWGTISLNPSPKKAWLRWLRWKKYYLNLTVTNIRHDRVTTELVDPHYGPPFIRPKDRQRMSMHNCFTLDSETAQYTCIGGCLDVFDDDPPVSHVPYSMVVISQHVSIWHCAYRPWGFHDDYDERTFWPSNNPTVGPTLSWRTQRLNKYIRSINPEWGRKAKGRNDSNTWGGTSTDAVESSNKMEPPSKISRYQ
jgi:hypothetical protein